MRMLVSAISLASLLLCVSVYGAEPKIPISMTPCPAAL